MDKKETISVELSYDEINCLIAACDMFQNHVEKTLLQFRHIDELYNKMDKVSTDCRLVYIELLAIKEELKGKK